MADVADGPVAPIPFAALISWLRTHNFVVSDKQTCYRLFAWIVGVARQAGVPEDRLRQALQETYHPRAAKRSTPQSSVSSART